MGVEGEESRMGLHLFASATGYRVAPVTEMVTKAAEQTWSRGSRGKLHFKRCCL